MGIFLRSWDVCVCAFKGACFEFLGLMLLEKDVCREAGFQTQLNKAYAFARSALRKSDARGESCVTLTPDVVEKKLPGQFVCC